MSEIIYFIHFFRIFGIVKFAFRVLGFGEYLEQD